jgi:hypothetical protein
VVLLVGLAVGILTYALGTFGLAESAAGDSALAISEGTGQNLGLPSVAQQEAVSSQMKILPIDRSKFLVGQ